MGMWLQTRKEMVLCPADDTIIGASVSNPHTSELNCDLSYISVVLSSICCSVYPGRCNLMQ